MSELVTGEAVVLDLRVARLPTRALGFVIDAVVIVILAIAAAYLVGALLTTADPAMAAAVLLATEVGILVGYPTLIETLTRGRSLGKLALGLRVVRDDGGPTTFRHAFTRALAGLFVDFWLTLGAGAVICSMLNRQGKRVGDLLAGTVVIKVRTAAQVLPPPPMPAPLAAWARGLDLTALPDDLALAVRTYLVRLPTLTPAAAEAMGGQLAASVAAYVSPPPPAGTPAWAYLQAVLAERRRRAELGLHAYASAAVHWPQGLTPVPVDVPQEEAPREPVRVEASATRSESARTPGGYAAPR